MSTKKDKETTVEPKAEKKAERASDITKDVLNFLQAHNQFDMARDEVVGRVVWICVLVIVGVIGIVVAARL